METSEITARLQSLAGTTPVGLTGLDPIPYGERRWNGAVWPDIQVDAYNRELARITSHHAAGYDVQHLIDGLYNLAHQFDEAGKRPREVQTGQRVTTADGPGYVYSIEHDWAAVVLDKHAGRSNAPIYWAKLTELEESK